MKQNMKAYKLLSKDRMRLLRGGFMPIGQSNCSMSCKNSGKTISINDCDGACGCSEDLQSCACVHNGSTQCSYSCEE